MLVITRYVGEKIIIGANGEIEITLVRTKPKQARIGVALKKVLGKVPVYREEVFINASHKAVYDRRYTEELECQDLQSSSLSDGNKKDD